MVNPLLLADDITSLCQLIDKDSEDLDTTGQDNFAINECLAYILHSFMPIVTKESNAKILHGKQLQSALLDFIDIINLKCKFRPFLTLTLF